MSEPAVPPETRPKILAGRCKRCGAVVAGAVDEQDGEAEKFLAGYVVEVWPTGVPLTLEACRCNQTWDALLRERDRLREALRRFGGHKAGCAFGEVPANNKPCDCGFDAALGSGRPSALEEEKGG